MRTKTLWIKEEYLGLILSGKKDVEVRVGYPNISRLRAGDVLLLNGLHSFEITRVDHYEGHEALLECEDADRIAPGMSIEGLLVALRDVYPPDKEALGVVALELRPLTNDEA